MRLGIVGSGFIVPIFLDAAALVEGLELRAICGRAESRSKVEELADARGIPGRYYDYADFLDDTGFETVYIALPNDLHYDWALKALEAGKHVILEKPFTANLDQAEALAQEAKKRGLLLFEAICNQDNPNYLKMKELLPSLGSVKIVQLNYTQYSRRYDLFKSGKVTPVFDAGRSGGALMDLGIYNIHFLLGLFGPPRSIDYHANLERGVDTSGILCMDYPGFTCAAVAAKDCAAPSGISIQGDAGCIHSEDSANSIESFTFAAQGGEAERFSLPPGVHRLRHELLAFRELFARVDLASRDERLARSVESMRILDQARRQIGMRV